MSVYGKIQTGGVAAVNSNPADVQDDDDWDSDPNYVNDISEKETRWGSKIIVADKNHDTTKDMDHLRTNVYASHQTIVKDAYDEKKMLYGGERAAQNKKD